MRSNLELANDRDGPIVEHDHRGPRASSPCGTAGIRFVTYKQVLGGQFRFTGDNHALLALVEAAYGGLPPQALPATEAKFSVAMHLSRRNIRSFQLEPPAPRIRLETGEVSAVIDASNYVVINPAQRCAQVVVSEDMLRHAYYVRYELIEFAVFILATRGLGLVPLHAACIGRHGRGLLLLGASGSGKSTLSLHCQLHGLDLLAEDAVFVHPAELLATGVPNYLHVRAETLSTLDDKTAHGWITRAPVIRRRSGVEKFEVDLRRGFGRTAGSPLELSGAVFVSAEPAEDPAALLTPLRTLEAARLLSAGQPHASGQPGWRRFKQRMLARGVHRLQRGRHPRDAIAALMRLLD